MKELKLALMGFGNCGQAFCKMLLDKEEKIEREYDTSVKVVSINTKTKGNLYNENGLDIRRALKDVEEKGKFLDEANLTDMSDMDVIRDGNYDCMVEMTPLNIFTGQPATDRIRDSLNRNKHVITANKGPIAWHYRELRNLAKEKGVGFFHETVVMDGTPIFNLAESTLKMAKVKEVSGILNSTTNFILEEMAKGTPEEEIMRRGREMGFIEADPDMDIKGYDAASKVTALLNVLMDAGITPDMVDRKGIEDITVKDIEEADKRGNLIKLYCKGTINEEGKVEASVKPIEVSKNDLLATVNSTTSVVSITTDLMGKISIVEHEPEIEQTAYGVFGDTLRVIELL